MRGNTAEHPGQVITKAGFATVLVGVVLLIARGANLIDAETTDIFSVVLIVFGAIAIAVDGEPRNPKP